VVVLKDKNHFLLPVTRRITKMVRDRALLAINVKKTYQFKTHCKDDAMISLH